MIGFFYLAAAVAIAATALAITRHTAAHAVLYLIVSLLAVALIFYLLGAPLVAAFEVIIYAGAIMVLFVFFIMMLNLGSEAERREALWLRPAVWIGPGLLALVLVLELGYLLWGAPTRLGMYTPVGPRQVALTLFGPYTLGIELSSLVLLAGLVGAYHVGSRVMGREGGGR